MKQKISSSTLTLRKSPLLLVGSLFAAATFTAIFFTLLTPRVSSASTCAGVFDPIPSWLMTRINDNKSVYVQVAGETGVPWEVLAAVHYREFNAAVSNPNNGQGIYQLYSSGQYFRPGSVSRDEFIHQTRLAANFIQGKAVNFRTAYVSPRKLTANETNIELIKNVLFSYNGRAYAYANQATKYGFNGTDQPYEGSPYVMSKFDCQRASMGLITTDGGATLTATDTRMGAFTLYARLKGDDHWKNLQANSTNITKYLWQSDGQYIYTDQNLTSALPYNAVLEPGKSYWISIKAKNIGNLPWKKNSAYLATSNPKDRSSRFQSNEWISSNRVATLTENTVNPGQTGTFTAKITAPNTTFSSQEYFSIVIEGEAWLNDIGLYFPITVSPISTITLYSDPARTQKITRSVYPSTNVFGRITFRNTLSSSITSTTALATSNPRDHSGTFYNSSWRSENRIRQIGANVPLYSTGTIDFTLTAPNTPGNYTESYGLVNDGVGWITDNLITTNLSVIEKPLNTLSAGESLKLNESINSANKKYTLRMQDDGNLVIYSPNRAIWASNTAQTGSTGFFVQNDDNLVIYSPNRATWASNTARSSGETLVMQDDGNLVLYSATRPVWASNTAGRQ
ncbi:hypothetical protein FJZ39_03630 [Candidatus Saccharibacteria bacterium]|nr:hypothetical protein [Candidatus Saccharibacteria bacterium]